MTKPAISAIYGLEPMRDGEFQTAFILGAKHKEHTVTSIEYSEHNYGDHGLGWFVVKSGDTLLVEMQARAVAEVYYKQADAA